MRLQLLCLTVCQSVYLSIYLYIDIYTHIHTRGHISNQQVLIVCATVVCVWHQCDNYEIRSGKYLGVCISVANNRLFVGSIPKNKTRESILEDFGKVTGEACAAGVVRRILLRASLTCLCVCFSEGLQEVILYTQPDDKKKNRGFCFLEYEDHKSAAQARRRLMSGKVKVWGNPVTVEWADPVAEPDPEVMAKVSLCPSARGVCSVQTADGPDV